MRRVILAWTLVVCGGCPDATDGSPPLTLVEFSEDEMRRVLARSPLADAPPDETNAWDGDDDAVALGHALFYEPRFSSDGAVSCATCHRPDHGFADDVALSETLGQARRHTPGLYNAAHGRWMFWDGRADSLWGQALGPWENPAEMDGDRVSMVRTVTGDEELRAAYEAAFGALPDVSDGDRFPAHARPSDDEDDPLHAAWMGMAAPDRQTVDAVFVRLGKAVAAFERQIVSTHAPFDTFVAGLRDDDADKTAALSESAQRGLKTFVGRGNCYFCHTGALFSDREFHNLGMAGGVYDLGRFAGVLLLVDSPFNAAGPHSDDPDGPRAERLRFVTSTLEQEGQFKTPSLRNVALTPPYMHDGRFGTLREVVHFYSELGETPLAGHREDVLIPLDLSPQDIDDLVAFLESLTDEQTVDARYLVPPAP